MILYIRYFFVCLLIATFFLSGAHSVSAATVNYYVDPAGTNSGAGTSAGASAWQTIQYAVTNVANPTTDTIIINISANTFTTENSTISIDRDFLDLTLRGDSATSTIVQPAWTPATSTVRVFNMVANEKVTFEKMTIRYGRLTSGSGAAINDAFGGPSLTIRDVLIDDNDGSGSFSSGGVFSNSSTTIERTTFTNNNGGYVNAYYGNSATNTITNTTFFNNTGGSAGGIYIISDGNTTFTNSLFASSSVFLLQGTQTVRVKNSILLGTPNGNAIQYYNFSGTVTNNGTNIIGGETGGTYFVNGVNGTVKLATSATVLTVGVANSLADNSSANGVPTLAIQAGSQAIDGGSGGANNSITIPQKDARGLYRGSIPDIGPYEYNATASAPSFSTPTVAATSISIGSISAASTTMSWTNGDGSMRAVFVKADATSGVASPVDGTVYAASSAFGSGSQIGSSGWYAVYNGTSTSVTVSNLNSTKNYRVHVVEYNGPYDATTLYFTTAGSGNPATKSAYAGSTLYANSSSGSDSTGNGTSGNPYKTFHKAYTVAVDGDTLDLTGTFNWTDAGETGDVSTHGYRIYKGNLTIRGQGAATTTIQAYSSLSAANDRRVFTFYTAGISLTVDGVMVRHGDSTSFGGCFGFQVASTTLTIQNSRMSSCRTRNGGSPGGSAIYANQDSTLVQIVNSSFDANTITSSSNGGTLYSSGTGNIFYITNTTFSGNQMSSGQGNTLYFASSGGSAHFTNTTIKGNYGGSSAIGLGGGTIYMKNSIFAETFTSNLYRSSGTYTSNGYNILGVYNTAYFNATSTGDWTDRTGSGTYSLFPSTGATGTLSFTATTTAANGTIYVPLSAGSIGIEHGTTTANGSVAIPTTDQLGVTRTAVPDIGAYEFFASADTTAPTISSVASSTTTTTATITWTTNESATSTVNYGASASYGTASSSQVLTTTHSIVLSGLTGSTLYHFQIVSTDAAGNQATSSNYTFTTAATPDTTAPTVSLTLPNDGVTIYGNAIGITATASDDTAVAGVRFYVNGVGVGVEDTTSPYSIVWNSLTATTSGSKIVRAVARDTSNNYSTSSPRTVTLANQPSPSSLSYTSATTTAALSWSTPVEGSSKMFFGFTTAFASTTPEQNTSSRVTSHSVNLSGLPKCTVFKYQTVSKNEASEIATSTESTFKTAGCSGGASILANNEGDITAAGGGSLTQGALTLTVPSSFTSTSSQATFQAKKLDGGTFFTNVIAPSGKTRAGTTVYNLSAYTDTSTTLDTFSSALSVTLAYEASDVANLDTSTLKIQRYDGTTWSELSSCTVNTSARTVTCTTTAFSDFAIFGDPAPSISSSSSGSSGGNGPIFTGSVSTLLPGYTAPRLQIMYPNGKVVYLEDGPTSTLKSNATIPEKISTEIISKYTSHAKFEKNLRPKMIDVDIIKLQQFLNKNGFIVATRGAGSSGNETKYFGSMTQNALTKFQEANGGNILSPLNLTKGTGIFGNATREFVNHFLTLNNEN